MIKVLVYGSCVSRDLVAIHRDKMECVDYIARQSWISATSSPETPIRDNSLTSNFQQEMLAGDFLSDAPERITEQFDSCDIILLDIVDDRFGIYPLRESFVTPSAEFASSGIRPSLPLGKHIAFGSDEHFDLWTSSARILRDKLGSNINRAFLLEVEFTDRSLDSSVVPKALGKNSSDWNQEYSRYYAFARSIGFQVMNLPSKLAISTKYHQWGIAPFHYVEAAYGWWLDRILERTSFTSEPGLPQSRE